MPEIEAILVLLVAVAGYAWRRPGLGEIQRLRWSGSRHYVAAVLAAVGIGFYDGIFGPGAGSFYMLAFVTLLGYGVVKATAHTKLVNFASNFGSLLLYAATGAVVWPIGLAMSAASLLGAQIGSRLAMRLGSRLIRPLLVLVSSLMALRLLLDPANPWRQGLLALF